LQRNALKRKESTPMETDSGKQIPPGTAIPLTAKAHLHQLCQQHKLENPVYNTVIVPTQSTNKGFFSTVTVGMNSFKSLSFHQKSRDAEQDAAQVALDAAKLLLEAGATRLNNASKEEPAKKNNSNKSGVSMKNRLQEHAQKNGIALPTYEVVHNEAGKTFSATVTVNGAQHCGVSLPSKKAAEASAAEVALISLGAMQT